MPEKLTTRALDVWGGRLGMRVRVAGTGSPVLYLHPATGPVWDTFLDRLAERHTVFAPEFPGTSEGDPYAVHEIHDLSDLILVYEELIRSLGLDRPAVIGASFGGMLAAELAARFPQAIGDLVLLAPLGLWRADLPVGNVAATRGDLLPGMLFHDPEGPAAQETFGMPQDPDEMRAKLAARIWSLGCTGKFVWPIPDRGLSARLHRVTARTLLVWGRQDKVLPLEYADDFGGLITGAKLEVIDECGHLPQAERAEQALAAVLDFLDGS